MKHLRFGLTRFIGMAAALLLPTLATAHPGHDASSSFMTGFWHPLSGLDHVLAALATGFWAAQLGGRAVVRLPLAFIAALASGAVLGTLATSLPGGEALVMGSVLALALLVALRVRVALTVAASLVSLFGVAHGYVHAIHAPLSANAGYVAGVVVANLPPMAFGLWFAGRMARSQRVPVT
jgi:urease accessory protein